MEINKKILFLAVSATFIFPVSAGAQTIGTVVASVVANVAWPIAIATVVIFWIVSGILFLSAMGSAEKLGLARKALIAAVAGTIVIILAASACSIIAVSLGIVATMCP